MTVWQSREYLLMLDIKPITPGHLLLVPKRHAPDLLLLPERAYARLMATVRKVSPVLRRAMEAERIGLVVEGFGVDHVHVHLVPINKAGELNPALAQPASQDDLSAVRAKLVRRFRASR